MKENEIIFGTRAIIEALKAGREIDKILMKRDFQSEISKELFYKLKERNIPIQRVPVEKLDRITQKNHQGVIALLSSVTYQSLSDIVPYVYEQGKDPFVVLLDGITDVRNFGAIARTCECAGVNALVIPSKGSVTVNADAMKTSAGALHTLPVCKEKTIKDAITFLKDSGFKIIAATEKGKELYTTVDYNGPIAIVMGAEDKGIAMDNLRFCDHLVSIPQFGQIGSLNVSVATGIILYEVVRSRS